MFHSSTPERSKPLRNRMFAGLLAAVVCLPAWGGVHSQEINFRFETFDVPGTPVGTDVLGVEDINNLFEAAGYVQVVSGYQYFGWRRDINGTITDLNDPLSIGAQPYTYADTLNNRGTIAGFFYDTAAGQFSGFFLQNGTWKTYNVPGMPAGTDTTIYGLNDFGDFCGYYEQPPYSAAVPYVNVGGAIDTSFNIPGSTGTYPYAINDRREIVGSWYDGTNTPHGFVREPGGGIRSYDAPGAGPLGTVLLGINVRGWMSGHFWDVNNHEHGFVVSPRGNFYQIDAPGAATNLSQGGTAGGGINDEGVMAGHYDPANGGPDRGYLVRIPPGLD